MKLTDFLQDVGRPIAYYPSLRKITGSTNATILLCQFIYWRGKESGEDGWLHKTSDDIEQETGLSYEEQKNARAKLRACGFLDERNARLEHKMYFRLNLEVIDSSWGKPIQPVPEQGNATFVDEDLPSPLNSNTEITTENTTIASEENSEPEQTAEQYNAELFRGDFHDYPETLWKIAETLRDTWMFNLPSKPQKASKKHDKSQYSFFLMAMENIKDACAEFGSEVLVKVHAEWKSKFRDGIAPYTVAQPSSLINMCAGKARELREAQGEKSTVTLDKHGIPESW